MTATPPGFARTAAVASRVEVAVRTGSTNADLVAAALDAPAAWPHLSVLLTRDQTAGRGRLDRSWQAPSGAALAVSVLVRVPAIPPAARGWVPLAAGAAMAAAVGAQLTGTGRAAGLKWPNDVLIDGGKVCGILAEAVPGDPHAVVVGAGVNTLMTAEQLPVPTATSFAAIGAAVDDDALVADWLAGFDRMLRALGAAAGDAERAGVHGEVAALCTTLGAQVRVALPGGEVLTGRAVALDADGRLVVDDGATRAAVSAGDVVHVRPA